MDDDDWANSAEMDALMAAAEAKPPPPPRTVLEAIARCSRTRGATPSSGRARGRRARLGCDVAVYWPTGSGKSLVYQVPALLHETGVLGHLAAVSLMMDQCKALNAKGMDVAVSWGARRL